MPDTPAPSERPESRAPADPGLLRLGLMIVIGAAAGALALGSVPWGDLRGAAIALLVLAATGVVAAVARTGLRGLISLDLGLLGGLALALWFRISLAGSGLSGAVSLVPLGEWRVACAASIAAGLFAPSCGFLIGDRLGAAARRIRRPLLVLGASLAGSLVLAGTLALALGTTALVIPEGVVILHVTVDDGRIELDPATVPAGEVYFIRSQRGHRYEGPFLESGTGPDWVGGRLSRGPLSDDDIARLQQGVLPGGMTVAELYGEVRAEEPPPWPTPDEYGGHEWLAAGRYAWWTLEAGASPGSARIKDLVIFTVE